MNQATIQGQLPQHNASKHANYGPIQRLLIIHLNLAEISAGNCLDESASDEELCEQILYFRSNCSSRTKESFGNGRSATVDPSVVSMESNHSAREAIEFSGLCSALYSLPDSIDPKGPGEREGESKTKEVYLDKSSLVFERLEIDSEQDIVAVAQISRRTPYQSPSSGGTPSAVAVSLQKCHSLFCLFRGGGIHKRLLSLELQSDGNGCQSTNRNGIGENNKECLYKGMDQLYNLRKKQRKACEKRLRQRQRYEKDGGNYENDIKDSEIKAIQSEIDRLSANLPIRSLRDDLRIHYNAFLDDMFSLVSENCVGACRSIVENVPAPIPLLNVRSHRYWSEPCALSPDATAQLGQAIKTFLESSNGSSDVKENTENEGRRPRLLGFSTFVRGQLISTQTTLEAESHTDENSCSFRISNETACSLIWYMASFRFKMEEHRGCHTPTETKPFGLSFYDDSSNAQRIAQPENGKNPFLGFLQPPRLSWRSASDKCDDFFGPDTDDNARDKAQKVWAPPVHLPLECSTKNSKSSNAHVDARICLYDTGDLSFLIYIDRGCGVVHPNRGEYFGNATINESPNYYKSVFQEIDSGLSNILQLALGTSSCAMPKAINRQPETASSGTSSKKITGPPSMHIETRSWKEPGHKIIFVDRRQHKLVLFADSAQKRGSNSTTDREKNHKKSRGWLRKSLLFKMASKADSSPASGRSSNPPDAVGPDCRYLLASQLPFDCCLALDDAMSEIHRKQREMDLRNNNSPATSTEADGIELCTLLQGSWVYAFSDGRGRELYTLFDASLYVTVADVQAAANRIRKDLLDNSMEPAHG